MEEEHDDEEEEHETSNDDIIEAMFRSLPPASLHEEATSSTWNSSMKSHLIHCKR